MNTKDFTRKEIDAIAVALHYTIDHTTNENLEAVCISALKKIEK
jgi:hypothetical protein